MEFDEWFIDCVMIGANMSECPDDYVWNLKEPGIWLDRFNSGMSPQEAVKSEFLTKH